MSDRDNSAAALVERLRRRAPELLDLLTAETDEQFEAAFAAILQIAIASLETNSKKYQELDEEGLSSILAASLSMPGLTVSREAHSNGHVDLIIQADHCVPQRKMLAEAKMYNGPEHHVGGLKQLLTRYLTGREGHGLLVEYFKKQNIAGLVKKIRERMDSELPLQQVGATADYLLRWSFLSTHVHSCGENLQVAHIGCNLYTVVVESAATETV
jgi:hypothetical protein